MSSCFSVKKASKSKPASSSDFKTHIITNFDNEDIIQELPMYNKNKVCNRAHQPNLFTFKNCAVINCCNCLWMCAQPWIPNTKFANTNWHHKNQHPPDKLKFGLQLLRMRKYVHLYYPVSPFVRGFHAPQATRMFQNFQLKANFTLPRSRTCFSLTHIRCLNFLFALTLL